MSEVSAQATWREKLWDARWRVAKRAGLFVAAYALGHLCLALPDPLQPICAAIASVLEAFQ